MNAEQAEKASRVLWEMGVELGPDRAPYMAVTRAVSAAIHPTITTIEELDALPDNSAISDKEGDTGVVHGEFVWYPETQPMRRSKVARICLPATVLHYGGTP